MNIFLIESQKPYPTKLTPAAKKLWERIPEQTRKQILANVWCTKCRKTVALQLREGKVSGSLLVLRGTCRTCGGDAARVIEQAE